MAGVILRGVLLSTILSAGPALAAAPKLAGGGSVAVSWTRIILAMMLCIVAVGVAVLMMKSKGGGWGFGALSSLARAQAQRRVTVLETRRISVHADACLLRCDGVDYLVLSSASAQQVLRQSPVEA